MVDDDVDVRFGASIEGFNTGVAEVKEQLEGFTGPLAELQENFAAIGEAMLAAFAVEKIIDFAKEMAELGEQAVRTSEMLGLTTEQVTELDYASTVTGGSASQMSTLLEHLSRTMQAAAEGGKTQIAAFQEAGIAYEDAQGHLLPLDQMLANLAARFADAPDGPEKTALAMTLMGRAGAEAIPLLNEGADGLAELKEKAEQAGVVLSGPVAEGMAKTADNNNALGQAFQGLSETLFQVFEPGLNAIVTAMTSWVEGLTDGIKNSTLLQGAVEDLAISFDVVVAAVEVLVLGFEELWTVGEEVVTALSKGLTSLASAMHDAVTLNWGAVGSDLSSGWQDQVANFQDTSDKLEKMAADTAKNISTMFGAQLSGNAPNSSGSPDDRDRSIKPFKPEKTDDGSAAKDSTEATRAEVDGEISVLQSGLSRKQALLNSELQMHQISEQQYVQQSEDAVNEEYQQELGLLQKELQIGGLKLAQRQQILNKIKELEQKNADDIQKIQLKAAQETAKTWQGVGDSISSSINAQVSSLLQGTESIGTALENVGLSLATEMVQNAIKSIVSSAAQSFAGVFAFMAPTMGPAAAGPAAAAQATVMAAAGSISGFDVGTWGLPNDMIAQVHAGETIIPAFESGQFRQAMAALASGGQGGGKDGGDSYHTHNWNGPVMDKRSLAKAVADMFDANPSLRPTY